MTIEVGNTGTTNTWQYLINRVNELAYAMSAKAVTVESNTAVGNAAIAGTLTVNNISTGSVKISNTISNVTISVPNTVMVANGSYYLNANGNWSAINFPISSNTASTLGTAPQEIDSYSMSAFGGAEFFVRVKDNIANGYQAVKILTYHNNVAAFSTEYGSMISNNTLGQFYVSTNTSHVLLYMQPTSANTSVTISRVNF